MLQRFSWPASLGPQSPKRVRRPIAITSYRASNRLFVKLRDLTLVATTLDLLVGAGVNEIGGVEFSVEQPSKLLDDARTQAVADARRKAEILAAAARVDIGAPISIAEQGATSISARKELRLATAASTPIAPG